MSAPIRILMADDNGEFRDILCQAIEAEEDMTCIACVADGRQALEAVQEYAPDLLILDHVMPNLDGLGVLEKLRGSRQRPKVIMLTAFGQESLIQRASELGADYYVMKPFDIPTLLKRIRQICDPQQAMITFHDEKKRRQIERQVSRELTELGMPAHFKGYLYLLEAITLVVQSPELLGAVTTKLYPLVAQGYNTNAHKVERAIRHAIESTWTRGNLASIEALFAHSVDANRGKPTNSSFIARLADHIRMDLLAS